MSAVNILFERINIKMPSSNSLVIATFFAICMMIASCNADSVNISRIDLVDLNNEPVKLADYKGKTMVLNFWATWCGPCRKEKPHLENARKVLEPEGFEFVAISQEELPVIQKYLSRKPDYQMKYFKTTNNIKLLGVFEIPQTYVLNKRGEVVYSFTGVKEWDSPENLAMLRNLAAK